MSVLGIIAASFGTLSSIANLPQVYKIFKRKSAKDISILTYSILFVGALAWIFYGIELKNGPIIITNTIGGISLGLVIAGWFCYGREKRKNNSKKLKAAKKP